MNLSTRRKCLGLLVALAIAVVWLQPCPSQADVIEDLWYDIATDPLTDWTELTAGVGTATRSGIQLYSQDKALYYWAAFPGLDSGNAFVVEAVVSVEKPPQPPSGDEISGARLAVDFGDPISGDLYRTEVRFIIDDTGNTRIALYDVADGMAIELASVDRDFSTSPLRFRVRIRRQQIGGVDYVFLETEPEDVRVDGNDETFNDPPRRVVVPQVFFGLEASGDPGGVYWGNLVSSGTYNSWWESIHLTFCDDPITLLPYWPPCDPGYERVGVECVDIDECSRGTHTCSVYAVCTNTPGSFTCACNAGFTGDGFTCDDVDECAQGTDDCDPSETCTNTVGGFSCGCADFFYDIATDPLTDWTEETSADGSAGRTGARFVSQQGALFYHQFFPGLDTGNAFVVEAVVSVVPQAPGTLDETSDARMAVEFREPGSDFYRVEVRFITSPAGELRIALFDVANSMETELVSLERDFSWTQPRFRVRVRRQQIGGVGYLFLEAEPKDVRVDGNDETFNDPPRRAVVLLSDLGQHFGALGYVQFGHLTNLKNSESWWESIHLTICDDPAVLLPNWSCDPGYERVGIDCVDIDECATGTDTCSVYATCSNTIGSYACACNAGFTGDGFTCTDIDECALGTDDCGALEPCTNSIGSFACGCADYFYDVATDQLIDWTEMTAGAGSASRTGITITSTNKSFYYLGIFPELDTSNAFVVEAVVSVQMPAVPGAGDEYSGARLTIDIPDPGSGELHRVEVRFVVDDTGQPRIALFDVANGEAIELASLDRDFSTAPLRYRVRVRRQQIGGVDYLFLESELEDIQVAGNDESSDDPPRRVVVPQSILGLETSADPGAVSWGNLVSSGIYSSWWENVHITVCADPTTQLPNWPICDPGYRRISGECVDIDECAIGADDCSVNATCTNIPGSFTCTCNTGWTGDGLVCNDVNECSQGTHNCSVNATCVNRTGSYTCTCNTGYTGTGWTCTDIDECAAGTDDCDVNATCANTEGSFTCTCNPGYTGDGRTCTDVDECTTGGDDCDVNATCTNTSGSFFCVCNTGYIGDGLTCSDIDECDTGANDCDVNAACANTEGSFTCTCNPGWTGDGRTCSDVDECAQGTAGCDINAYCTNTPGSSFCTCNSGYTGDGLTCSDIDECAAGADDCDANAACANTAGSFTCTCNSGYAGDGWTCTDIDECAAGACDTNATCTNTEGSFTCACNTGFTGDGLTCTDIDECSTGADNCDSNATCTNTAGSFTCACDAGYEGDGQTCTDVDECSTGADDCDDNATCTNTDGSFSCACNAGYTGDGRTCTDIDECTDGTADCHANAACTNTTGSFTCACNAGYTGDGRTCSDIDECATGAHDCGPDATCENTDGDFTCIPLDKDNPGGCGCNAGSGPGEITWLFALALAGLLRRRRSFR